MHPVRAAGVQAGAAALRRGRGRQRRQSLDDDLLRRLPRNLANLERRRTRPSPKGPLEPVPICHVNLARETKLRGGESQTELLIRGLSACGLRQRAVVWRDGTLDWRLEDTRGLTVCPVGGRLSAARACRGAQLVHAHEAHAAHAAWAARAIARDRGNYLITRRDVVTRGVGEPVPRASRFTRRVYGNAGAVVTVSEAIAEEVRERQAGTAVSLTRIPDAWMLRLPDREAAKAVRARFGSQFLVGHAAAMDHEVKGQHVLLEAARRLEHAVPEAQFALLGGGRLEDALRAQAQGLSNVHFEGWVDDPLPWIVACDVFVLPSLREGLGSVALDALRFGVPVVASRTGGIPEVVTEDCGVLVPPGDAAALAAALERLARDPELLERLSKGAQERADEFDPLKMVERYLEVYRGLGLVVSTPLD